MTRPLRWSRRYPAGSVRFGEMTAYRHGEGAGSDRRSTRPLTGGVWVVHPEGTMGEKLHRATAAG